MFLIIAFLLDKGRLSIWMIAFKFGVFMTGIPVRSGNGMEGMGLSVWCVGALRKLSPDIIPGGKFIPKGFWVDVPTC